MQQKIPENMGWYIIAASIFIYINTLLLRTLSSLLDIPFDLDSLLSSDVVQTCFSILWTIIGAGLFIVSKQKNNRTLWFSAMSLIGVVVLKLFVIDLANSGSIERIISFIVVGLLLLAVGYLIPVPEKEKVS